MAKYGIEQSLFVILVVFLVLGWVSCLLRAWVKLFVIKKITADDYLMFLGLLFYTAYSASGLYGVTHGVGSSGRDAMLEQASIGLRAWWLCEVLYAPVTLCVRTSVALFLLQIAVQRIHRRVILVTIVAFWAVTIPLFFVAVFQCSPVDYFWKQPFPTEPRGTCMDGHVIFVVSVIHSAISASCDWVLGILPIFMLWKVRLNKRTKLTLTMLLSMGIFAGIALIVRIAYVRPLDVDVNFLYNTLNVANWSILEPSVCIIAGCLATLRPLFTCFGRSSVSRSTKKTPNRYRQTGSTAKSRTVKSIRGVGFIFNPTYLNPSKKDYTVASRRTTGFMRSTLAADETIACNDYELMVNIDKGTSPFDQNTFENKSPTEPPHCKRTSRHSEVSATSTKNEEPDDDEAAVLGQTNNQLQPPEEVLRRHSMPSNGSLSSNISNRFSSHSSAAALAQTQEESLDETAPMPNTQSPPHPPTPCKILVKKSMVVEYDLPSPTTASNMNPSASLNFPALAPNPALSMDAVSLPPGTTMSSMHSLNSNNNVVGIAGDDASETAVFRGDHSVKITGPGRSN